MPLRPRLKSRHVYSGQVAEAVLQIMEQGPQPMIDMRPSKRNPNSADQFRSEHLAEYKSYEAQDRRDGTRNVENHNAAYPKMKDELEKRRSAARATAPITAKRRPTNQTYYDPHCRLCQKLKMAVENKKRATRTKPRNERKRPSMKSKVSKPKKRRNSRSTFKLCKLRRNIGIQYCEMPLSNEASTSPRTDDQDMSELYFSNCDNQSNSRHSQDTPIPRSQNGSTSDVQNPDTSTNSVSSYNSNMSLEHEPMVSH